MNKIGSEFRIDDWAKSVKLLITQLKSITTFGKEVIVKR